jgi:16S rRNA (cytosine1402-N4)-methyltransferase
VRGNFKDIKNILKKLKIGKVDGILADLGWRIEQVKDKEYGMSFIEEARLDMRLDKCQKLDAYEIINNYEEKELERVFREWGEIKLFKRLVKIIMERRREFPIERTTELAEIAKESLSEKRGIHPATKVFQALRIEVNDELSNLDKFLNRTFDVLKKKGRLAVISFHSLEDRLVKNFFRENARGCVCPRKIPVCVCGGDENKKLKIIAKKPLRPSTEELAGNFRARSAKLRIAEKI